MQFGNKIKAKAIYVSGTHLPAMIYTIHKLCVIVTFFVEVSLLPK